MPVALAEASVRRETLCDTHPNGHKRKPVDDPEEGSARLPAEPAGWLASLKYNLAKTRVFTGHVSRQVAFMGKITGTPDIMVFLDAQAGSRAAAVDCSGVRLPW